MESVELEANMMQREEPAPVPMRIFCQENTGLNMAARGRKVLLVKANPEDKSQHWFQCYDVGKLTDNTGRRAFVLVNRTTGEAMVSNINNVLRLLPYSGHVALRTSMLWTQGGKLEDDFSEIRTFDDISEILNGLGGNVLDGTVVGLYPSSPQAPNAIWKIEPIHIDSVE